MSRPRAQFKTLIEELEITSTSAALNKKIIQSFDELKSDEQMVLLGFACHRGLLPSVQHILKQNPKAINAQTNAIAYFESVRGHTPFDHQSLPPLLAAMDNPDSTKYKLIEWLLTQPGLNIHEKGVKGGWDAGTVFYMTTTRRPGAAKKELALLSGLLKAGLDLIPSTTNPTTLFMEFLQEGELDFFKEILRHPLNWSRATKSFKRDFQEEFEMVFDFEDRSASSKRSKNEQEILRLLIRQDLPDDFKLKEKLEQWAPEEAIAFQREKLSKTLPSASTTKHTARL